MKMRVLLSGLFLLAAIVTHAQVFPIMNIMDNGDPENRINLVFLSDGYRASELDKYEDDVKRMVNNIFSQTPFKEYKAYFNVIAIKVPSNQSGASHDQTSTDSDADCQKVPKSTIDNYFGSAFDTNGIHRLLVPKDYSKIMSVLAATYPQYDQVFMLVNSPYYGGSGGGNVATSSIEIRSNEVAIHEIGHSLGTLADEYWAGDAYAAERPNLTKNNNTSTMKWKKWLNVNGIGIYAHDENKAWYRPHQDCKMRKLNSPFCSVCRETFTERFHTLVNPVLSYSPSSSPIEPVGDMLNFYVETLKPAPNTIKITWTRNGKAIPSLKNKEGASLPVTSFSPGDNIIEAQVTDTTTLSKSDTHLTSHIYTITWNIKNDRGPVGVELETLKAEYDIAIFPNPVSDWLNVSYSISRPSRVAIRMTDVLGKTIKSLVNEDQLPGKHAYRVNRSDLNMNRAGVYYLILDINSVRVSEKLIRE